MAESRFPLSERARLLVTGVMTVAILAMVNLQIAGKERTVLEGTTVLLQLAPIDPRSLLQGDYMALRYAMANEVAEAAETAKISDGRIVIELDDGQVAQFVAIYDGRPLTANRHLLRFRKRGKTVRLASDAYFFEEGQGETYRNARFGELRVADNGNAVLTGLRDQALQRLGPPQTQ